jgi:hypothetical protein
MRRYPCTFSGAALSSGAAAVGSSRRPTIRLLAASRRGTFHEIGIAYGSVDEALRQSILLRDTLESQPRALDEALDAPEPSPSSNPFVLFCRSITAVAAGIFTGQTRSGILLSPADGSAGSDACCAEPSVLLLRRELGAEAIVAGLRLERRDRRPVGYMVPLSPLISIDEEIAADLVSIARRRIGRGRDRRLTRSANETAHCGLAADLLSANESLDALRDSDGRDG